ncbi:MAG TPA: NADH-quinone oxidoreductase subunit C [Anaerolineales bacterium]|nr:NADH-quinone oxidoreductase subunit C [Anaerolineales bacterium]
MSHLSHTLSELQAAFGTDIQAVSEFRGETTVVVEPTRILAISQYLHDQLSYTFLADLAAVDYFPEEPRFAVSYVLFSLAQNTRFRVKVFLEGDEPSVDSVSGVWLSANWHEREAYDLMGIHFNNHPDLRRILMPAEWEGHPQRKDYPLGYEEIQFSFNWREVDGTKSYAKDRSE